MSVRGDFALLRSMRRRLERLRDGDMSRTTARRAAPKVQRATLAAFDARRTPYGDAWAPFKRRRRPGRRTGAMRGSIQARAVGGDVELTGAGKHYQAIQNRRRPFIPSAGWPPRFARAFRDAARRAWDKIMGRRA